MSKIEEYNILKAQLEAVNQVDSFSLSPVDNDNWNGPKAQFIVNGGNPLFIRAFKEWIQSDPVEITNQVKEFMALEVNKALLDATKETTDFIEITLPQEVEYLSSKAYIISPVVESIPIEESPILKG